MVQLTKKSKGSPYKRVRLTFEFLARNPTPQFAVGAKALEEMLNKRLKGWIEFHKLSFVLPDNNEKLLQKMFGTDFRMDSEKKTGILHPDWYPDGALNNIRIRVEELKDTNDICKKPKLWYRVLAFFKGIG